MTDAFADVLDGESGEASASDTEAVTDSASSTSFVDEKNVRTTLPDNDGTLNDDRYEDEEDGDAADDVDPRKLFRQPTVDELRYYYREGPYGGTIVEKPILDAFKHGFEVTNDNTEREDGSGKIRDFLDDYLPYYFMAEIKSRRDGLAVLMFHVVDEAESAADPIPDSGGTHEGFQVWTLDNLSDNLGATKVADHTEYDDDQIYVSEGTDHGGIAIVDDISHPDHGDIVGYGVEPRQESTDVDDVAFVHEDRCQHFVWGERVDGPVGNNVTGKHVGESILTGILQPLKAAQMGFWAIKNILYRYSAPLHAVEPPETWGQDEFDKAREKLGNLSMSSDAVLPPGSELSVAEGTSEFDPEPTFDVLVESMCAGTVFTKSVLEGSQVGTVSGSETDVKGYFNGVQRIRTGRTERKFREAVQKVAGYDQQTIPRVAGTDSFDIDWGPLFKPTDAEMAEGMVSVITAVTNGIKNYVITPEEAREIVEAEWAQFDADVDFDELAEDDWDNLDRINMNEAGQGVNDNEPDASARENPTMQNGGGQPAGQNRESSQPTRTDAASRKEAIDALQSMSDGEYVDAITDE